MRKITARCGDVDAVTPIRIASRSALVVELCVPPLWPRCQSLLVKSRDVLQPVRLRHLRPTDMAMVDQAVLVDQVVLVVVIRRLPRLLRPVRVAVRVAVVIFITTHISTTMRVHRSRNQARSRNRNHSLVVAIARFVGFCCRLLIVRT